MSDRLYYGSTLPRYRAVGVISVVTDRRCWQRGRFRWDHVGRRCPGHALMVDYDGRDLHRLRAEVIYAQRRFELGSAHVFRTLKGFHVYFADVLPFRDAAWVLSKMSGVESRDHAVMGASSGYWTLRISPKARSRVQYVETISGDGGRYRWSRGHAWFLHRWGGIPKPLLGLDGLRRSRRWVGDGRVVWEPYKTPYSEFQPE